MGFGDPVLQEWAKNLEVVRQIVAFFNGPDPFVVLTWLDSDPDEIRAKARVLAGDADGSAYALLTTATTQLQARVSAVDSAWQGPAADEFVRYMTSVKTYTTEVALRLQRTSQAGMALATAVQQVKDDSLAYMAGQLEAIGWAVGEIVAGILAGTVVPGVGNAVGAVVGAVVAIIHYVYQGILRIGAMQKMFNGLDNVVPNAVGDLNQVPFAETETGFDDATDISEKSWQPTG